MVDVSLLIRLVLAFAVGSLWVTVITLVAEKKGSVIGGVLGGLPSTSAFSFSSSVSTNPQPPPFKQQPFSP